MSETPTELIGGRYRVQAVLGEGGMGAVYRVWDENLQVVRAVKVLHAARTLKEDARQRMQNEARAMARLRHPNVVVVHDVVTSESGDMFLVMEHVEGGTLEDRLNERGTVDAIEAITWMVDVLKALELAHDEGIIHRDLKPSNLLIGPDGVKLADFGIAQLADADETLTQEGIGMGTRPYMPPEQWYSASTVDGRADVYAAAATLYRLVTGEIPKSLWLKDASDPTFASISEPLRKVLIRATRTRPESRHAAVAELRLDLERARSILEGNPPPKQFPWVSCLLVAAILGGGSALVGGGMFAASLWPTATPNPPQPLPVPTTTSEPPAAPEPERDAPQPAVRPAPQPRPVPEPIASPPQAPDLAPDPAPAVPEPVVELPQIKAFINSLPPGAEIRLDGESLGSTPFVGRLPEGEHAVELHWEGQIAVRRVVQMTGEEYRFCWDTRIGAVCPR